MGNQFVLDSSETPGKVVPSERPDLLETVSEELLEYHRTNQKFSQMEPEEVLSLISSITARLTYLRACLMQSGNQRATKLRTTNLDPLLQNLDLQFKIASRQLTSRQFEYEITRGAPT